MMARLTKKAIRWTLKRIESCRPQPRPCERDWRAYESELAARACNALRSFGPLIDEAASSIRLLGGRGRRPSLSLQQKARLLLIKQFIGKSNRLFSEMLLLFSSLTGLKASYKTVERLYSDEAVNLLLFNVFSLVLRRSGVARVDACGDGTGYSLTIKKHYASYAEALKKGKTDGKRRSFVFSFSLMDLDTWMYVCCGTSMKSEKEAFDRAMKMLIGLNVKVDSVRLDRYYSSSACVSMFGDAKVYVIPKKNATTRGSTAWKASMKAFVDSTKSYLEQYYRRNNSESGFSTDKRRTGWMISQRRFDRMTCAILCTALWHNLFRML